MSHSPSPSSRGLVPHYPESELEHSHSRIPSTGNSVSFSPIPSSRSSPFSLHPPSHSSSPSPSQSPASFVSFSSIPSDSSDDPLTSVSSQSVDAEELTRQSLGGSRTSSPRLPHSALSSHGEPPLPLSSSITSPLSASSSSLSSSFGLSLPSPSPYHPTSSSAESVEAAFRGLTLGSTASSSSAVDQTVLDIIARTRALEEQAGLPSVSNLTPSSTSSSVRSMSPSDSSSSSYEQSAVVNSAGLLQLSQRLQELSHPLSKRLMLSFGAASGQMKSGDYVGCVVTCKRAFECIESWPSLSSLTVKDAMARLLKSFKVSFTSSDSDPLHCRLLYVEFFLTLSALLLPTHTEWAMALQSSAQKGLKATPQEAIKSLTKITKLLFTAGLNKPPSAYRSRGGASHLRGATVGVERVEKVVDVRAVEVEQAVRMMGHRTAKVEEKREGQGDAVAGVEEKRLTAEDVEVVYLSLGLHRHFHKQMNERSQETSFDAVTLQQHLSKLPPCGDSPLNVLLQQLVRPSSVASPQSTSLSSASLSSPSVRVPSAVVSAATRSSSSSRVSTPLSAQRQLKFHASSSQRSASPQHHGRSLTSMISPTSSPFLSQAAGKDNGAQSPSSSSTVSLSSPLLQLPELQAAVQANARDESVELSLPTLYPRGGLSSLTRVTSPFSLLLLLMVFFLCSGVACAVQFLSFVAWDGG